MTLSERKKKLTRAEYKWRFRKEYIERKRKLQEEKFNTLFPKKKTTVTKLLIAFVFINCTIIELFTGWATIQSIYLAKMFGIPVDFSPLIALIGAVVGEVMGYAVYAIKSTKENTLGGIVYEMAVNNQEVEEFIPQEEDHF